MGTKKQPDTSHDTAPATAHTGLADALFSTTQQREFARLAHSGLVTQQTIGRQKHYQANASAPIFGELCGAGLLHAEPAAADEYAGLLRSNLAALRWHGYRPANKRFIVFQILPNTLGLGPEVWRVLAKGHDQRNLGEYEGHLDIDERFVTDLVAAFAQAAAKITALPPPTPNSDTPQTLGGAGALN